MPTLKAYTDTLSAKLGGWDSLTVSLDANIEDNMALRSVLTSGLYDSEKDPKSFAGNYVWSKRLREQRRVREHGYTISSLVTFTPPASGTYRLILYGYGQTALLSALATNAQIQAAIEAVHGLFVGTTVTGTSPRIIEFATTETIDVGITAGSIGNQNGIARLEVTQGFSTPLVKGDEVTIHSKLPVVDADGYQGLRSLVNLALRRMWFIDVFPITPVEYGSTRQSIFGTTQFPWLTYKQQVIALFGPAAHRLVSTFTPPSSGSFTLSFLGAETLGPTASISVSGLTGQVLQDALRAISGLDFVEVSPLGASGSYTLLYEPTEYAQPAFSASAGTLINTVVRLEQPARAPHSWNFQFDANTPHLYAPGYMPGASFFVEAYRQGHSYICPQIDYNTVGTTWVDSTEGLSRDMDQAMPDLDSTVALAYYLACLQLASKGPQAETQYWENKALEAGRAAAFIKLYDLPMDVKPRGRRTRGTSSIWGTKGLF
jgi:hypothetical protein